MTKWLKSALALTVLSAEVVLAVLAAPAVDAASVTLTTVSADTEDTHPTVTMALTTTTEWRTQV